MNGPEKLALRFGMASEAGPEDALLLEGRGADAPGQAWFTVPATGHAIGCACCLPRNEAGRALGRLLLARARGEGPFFRNVVAVVRTEAGRAAVEDALRRDPIAVAWFK